LTVLMPKLKVLDDKADKNRVAQSCQGKDYCSSCVLFHKNQGRCSGCTPEFKAELPDNFKECYQESHECTGYKVDITAICWRWPRKATYRKIVTKCSENPNLPRYVFENRSRLAFKQRAILNLVFLSQRNIDALKLKGDHFVFKDEVYATTLSFVKGM